MGKYWVLQVDDPGVAEAVECLGGNGYVEESGMPRLYREIPLNSISEGFGNVDRLDVLRVLRKTRKRQRRSWTRFEPAESAAPRRIGPYKIWRREWRRQTKPMPEVSSR